MVMELYNFKATNCNKSNSEKITSKLYETNSLTTGTCNNDIVMKFGTHVDYTNTHKLAKIHINIYKTAHLTSFSILIVFCISAQMMNKLKIKCTRHKTRNRTTTIIQNINLANKMTLGTLKNVISLAIFKFRSYL
jgi:hypothetical protein